jgi:hypothetical protein
VVYGGVMNSGKDMNYKILSFLLILLLCYLNAIPSFGEDRQEGWMPEWEVGDWWIVKQRTNAANFPYDSIPQWHDTGTYRFEVLGQEEVNKQLCYAVERKSLPSPLVSGGTRYIYYFHKDNLRPVRKVGYSYRSREFSIEDSNPPHILDYQYSRSKDKFDRPIFSSGFSLPAFPLAVIGDRAKALSEPGQATSKRGVYVSQVVSIHNIEEFNQELSESKIEISKHEKCYSVIIESWSRKTGMDRKRNIEFDGAYNYTRQIWWKTSPWSLYHEYGMVAQKDHSVEVEGGAKKGTRIPMRREWLIDWSSRYKIIEDQKK